MSFSSCASFPSLPSGFPMIATTYPGLSDVGVLLRGEPKSLRDWIENWDKQRLVFCAGIILLGAGGHGVAIGWWRDPRQALFVAIQFPLSILLTTIGNGLLNAMLAPLLGVNISVRQSILAILMSFTIASAILGSFSPLIAFLVWTAPPLAVGTHISDTTYGVIQLSHVLVITFPGIVANLGLVQLLRQLGGSASAARRVLVAWLIGNLFLGS